MSAAKTCQDGRTCRVGLDEQDVAAQPAQRSAQGIAWRLATALAARTVDQHLVDALRQAVPPARDIRHVTCMPLGHMRFCAYLTAVLRSSPIHGPCTYCTASHLHVQAVPAHWSAAPGNQRQAHGGRRV
jgi:hypothetical protein